jgi:hypothetical protein
MKPLVSGLIGALVAIVLLTGWSGRTTAESQLVASQQPARGVRLTSAITASDAAEPNAALGPVSVQCAPGQRAVVRQAAADAGIVSHVECVAAADEMIAWSGYAPASGSARVVPAVYTAPAQERVVYRERRTRNGRSWKKTALVIGGSTGAGAGVGAIAGGKKGALIGAAIGGGASTLYEAMKHR